MAKATSGQSEEGYTEMTDNDQDSWTEIASEQQIVLDAVGDEFSGIYNGMEETANGIKQAYFTLDDPEGADAFITAGHDLQRKLQKVVKGSHVKVRWESQLNTGQKTMMRIYKVLVRNR